MIDPVQRAHRWQSFAEEDQGLYDMIEAMQKTYFAEAQKLMPHQTNELAALGMAMKVADEIRNYITLIIAEGENEKMRIEHADKVMAWKADKPSRLHKFSPF